MLARHLRRPRRGAPAQPFRQFQLLGGDAGEPDVGHALQLHRCTARTIFFEPARWRHRRKDRPRRASWSASAISAAARRCCSRTPPLGQVAHRPLRRRPRPLWPRPPRRLRQAACCSSAGSIAVKGGPLLLEAFARPRADPSRGAADRRRRRAGAGGAGGAGRRRWAWRPAVRFAGYLQPGRGGRAAGRGRHAGAAHLRRGRAGGADGGDGERASR